MKRKSETIEEKEKIQAAIISCIKEHGPISAVEIGKMLDLQTLVVARRIQVMPSEMRETIERSKRSRLWVHKEPPKPGSIATPRTPIRREGVYRTPAAVLERLANYRLS